MTPGAMIDRVCGVLGVDAFAIGLQLVATSDLDVSNMPTTGTLVPWVEQQGLGSYTPPLVPFPLVATRPALVYGRDDVTLQRAVAGLLQRYPTSHHVQLIQGEAVQEITLAQLAELANIESDALVYVPALAVEAALRDAEGSNWVVMRLLGPDGCPWDLKQTHQSLRTGLIEEAYEVLEALDAGDMVALEEELGDLMLQTLVHAEMARQAGHFDLGDVHAHLASKLINRHPHVFGSLMVDGTGEVLRNWEAIKGQELAAQGRERTSALDGVPRDLPALAAAQKLCKKAARVGFDWPDKAHVWKKLQEELVELEHELADNDPERATDELGDVLFCLANLARWLDVDAETALRHANAKFRQRFTAVEASAAAQGTTLREMELPAMLELWRQAKG